MRAIYMFIVSGVMLLASTGVAVPKKAEGADAVPTFADAVVILAKYSGLFDRYVSKDASLDDCFSFLNSKGIYFGMMEVAGGVKFGKNDCARVMGQIELVMSGEAEYSMGKVKLPKGIDSWTDFCIMNDIQYMQGYAHVIKGMVAIRQFGN